MIETSLMVDDYPEPPEIKEKGISGQITLIYDFEAEVNKNWDYDAIIEDIKENLKSYIDLSDYEEIDIDVY